MLGIDVLLARSDGRRQIADQHAGSIRLDERERLDLRLQPRIG